MKYLHTSLLIFSLLIQGCATEKSNLFYYQPTIGDFAPNYEQYKPNNYAVVVIDSHLKLNKLGTNIIDKGGNYPPGKYTLTANYSGSAYDPVESVLIIQTSVDSISKNIKLEAGHRYLISGTAGIGKREYTGGGVRHIGIYT